MPDIYAGDDNRSVMANGVRLALPDKCSDWMDVVDLGAGQFGLVESLPTRKALYTIRVDQVAGRKPELRNFNAATSLTLTDSGYVEGPKGAVAKPALIDFARLIPPAAVGVRVTYDATISGNGIGELIVNLGPDGAHWTAEIFANKHTARPLQIHEPRDVFFRRQLGQKVAYTTASKTGLDKALTVPKFLIHGWWT